MRGEFPVPEQESEHEAGFSGKELAKELEEQKKPSAWKKWAARVGLLLTVLPAPRAVNAEKEVPPPPSEGISAPLNPEQAAGTEATAEALTGEEKQRIIEHSGYEGLAEHELKVVDRLQAGETKINLISLDGAQPTVDRDELSRQVEYFDALARQGKTINYEIQLDADNALTVPYRLDASTRRERNFIFTPAELDLSTISHEYQPGAAPDAFTSNASPEVSVSVLKDVPRPMGPEQFSQQVNLNEYFTAVEACQGAVQVNLDPVFAQTIREQSPNFENLATPVPGDEIETKLENLRMLGQEAICNSESIAINAAKRGLDYQQYEQLVQERGTLLGYEALNARFIALQPRDYQQLVEHAR